MHSPNLKSLSDGSHVMSVTSRQHMEEFSNKFVHIKLLAKYWFYISKCKVDFKINCLQNRTSKVGQELVIAIVIRPKILQLF